MLQKPFLPYVHHEKCTLKKPSKCKHFCSIGRHREGTVKIGELHSDAGITVLFV